MAKRDRKESITIFNPVTGEKKSGAPYMEDSGLMWIRENDEAHPVYSASGEYIGFFMAISHEAAGAIGGKYDEQRLKALLLPINRNYKPISVNLIKKWYRLPYELEEWRAVTIGHVYEWITCAGCLQTRIHIKNPITEYTCPECGYRMFDLSKE